MFKPHSAFLFNTGWLYRAESGSIYVSRANRCVYFYCPADSVGLYNNLFIIDKRHHLPVVAHVVEGISQLGLPIRQIPLFLAPKLSPWLTESAEFFCESQDIDEFFNQYPLFSLALTRLSEVGRASQKK